MSVFTFSIGLFGCNGDSNEINVKMEVERIFKNYNYDLNEGMKRDFVSYYNVFVLKQDLSLDEFEKVKVEIEKKWRLVYTSEDQYVFCYDKYNQMTILYPRKMDYFDKFGQKLYIKSSSLDKWGVSLKYIKEGTSYCKDEKFN
ncbi:hypothetical protein KTJ32_19485 [Acinetobacter gyllenbergii]|uniref:hypothetical protein n=1 Tax=Acinetobacter gyllenbergii TaxID=134534 RepID=UPI0021CE3D71|nr:hypothetical protein [Acinetobacter gyllenbergii]MCU4583179.1 hypothetical protein [Acinetobacter gyllenbergii]